MDNIEIELNLNSITDTLKSLSDGIKEHRSTKLIDVEGKGISITIACNREDHFLKDLDKDKFIHTGIFLMTLTGPKSKQVSIEDFGDEDKKKPKTKGELRDEINATVLKTIDEYANDEDKDEDEILESEIFELENEPKRAYYTRDGQKFKTKAFIEHLEK